MSLSHSLESAEAELKKMVQKGWYSIFEHLPFVPCRTQAQGAVPRKMEQRWRRVIDAGPPRKPVFDTDDRLVVPLNKATKGATGMTKQQWLTSGFKTVVGASSLAALQQRWAAAQVAPKWPIEAKPAFPEVVNSAPIQIGSCSSRCAILMKLLSQKKARLFCHSPVTA